MSIDKDTRQAVVAAFEADEAVKLVKQLVDIPSPEGEELECARFLHCAASIAAKLIRKKQRAEVIVALGISAMGAALDRQFLSRSSFQYFFESQSAQSDVGNPLPRIVLE